MSDYISKSRLKEVSEIQKGDFNSVESIRAWIDSQPTLDETEIIRKYGEQIIKKLEDNSNFLLHEMGEPKMYAGNESAIEIIKEECGVNE